MGETKSYKGNSGKKRELKTEQVSKLDNYIGNIELVAMEFSPKDRIYEKGENSTEDANGATDETTGKKEIDIGQNLYISAGNTVEYEFNPQELSKQYLQMAIKGKNAQKSARKAKKEVEKDQGSQEK